MDPLGTVDKQEKDPVEVAADKSSMDPRVVVDKREIRWVVDNVGP
jgi:ERCC4-type nuclease